MSWFLCLCVCVCEYDEKEHVHKVGFFSRGELREEEERERGTLKRILRLPCCLRCVVSGSDGEVLAR